jgi:hypothetical protein
MAHSVVAAGVRVLIAWQLELIIIVMTGMELPLLLGKNQLFPHFFNSSF